MIKTIKIQNPTQMTIMKDGKIIADLYIPGINGNIDTDAINLQSYDNHHSGICHIKLEV